jgi:DMSO/TMAO reductase YedYZ heme-binding membrane subunit
MNLAWDVARAGGLMAWTLATASVVWGLALSTRLARRRPWPAWLLDMHRLLGALAVIFTVVHVGAVLLDSYTNFGLADVLVPLAASWHPVAVAWGIVAFYVLLAVEVTSLLRGRIGKRWWRRVHYGSFALFVFATVHAVMAGTDTKTDLVLAAIVLLSLPVAAMTAVRIGSSGPPPLRTTNVPTTNVPTTAPSRPDARVAAGAPV